MSRSGALCYRCDDLLWIRVFARCLLRGDELAVHSDLEHATAGGDERDLGDAPLDLVEQPFRQTDGSGTVASASAVLDAYLHGESLPGITRAGTVNRSMHPLRNCLDGLGPRLFGGTTPAPGDLE